MRLINTYTGEFEEFQDFSKIPPYAILSHTWDSEKGEQSYQDVRRIQEAYKLATRLVPASLPTTNGYPDPSRDDTSHLLSPELPSLSGIWELRWGLSEKIRKTAEIARRYGFRYMWVDSSCINKESSSELSEAINSMYNWYCGARVCFAFLSDVPFVDHAKARDSQFRRSRWFTRGWTLQELIGPRFVFFFSMEWKFIQTKAFLSEVISDITNIDRAILLHREPLDEASIAKRMSWAAKRQTTRVEDRAYSLLGIFGINMPTLYGEGQQAFRRLQEEILWRFPDHTLFVWGTISSSRSGIIHQAPRSQLRLSKLDPSVSLFSPSPSNFSESVYKSPNTVVDQLKLPPLEYTRTPYGLRTEFRLLPLHEAGLRINVIDTDVEWYLAILGCSTVDSDLGTVFGRVCYIPTGDSQFEFLYPGTIDVYTTSGTPSFHILALKSLDGTWYASSSTKTVYLPHPVRATLARTIDRRSLTLTLSKRDAALQKDYGHRISEVRGPTERHPDSHSFTLSNNSFTIYVKFLHMICEDDIGEVTFVTARFWVLALDHANPDDRVSAPPFAATTWDIHWAQSSLTSTRSITILYPPARAVTVELGLDILASSQYDVRVAMTSSPSLTESLAPPCQLRLPHEHINVTMLGRVRSALEERGYVVHFEGPRQDYPRTHIFTISKSEFSIVIRYTHELGHFGTKSPYSRLFMGACVTLESRAYQDGPYALGWTDWYCQDGTHRESDPKGWRWSLDQGRIPLTGPSGEPLTLRLGLDLAWRSEYYVDVDVVPGDPERRAFLRPKLPHALSELCPQLRIEERHGRVKLTLPGHIRRALEELRYEVRFQEPPNEDPPVHHALTLSTPQFTVAIEYSHAIDVDEQVYGGPKLTLRADVKLTEAGAPHHHHSRTVQHLEWVVSNIRDWNLGPQETTLALAIGGEMTLRLDFDFLWFTEYGIVVEVIAAA